MTEASNLVSAPPEVTPSHTKLHTNLCLLMMFLAFRLSSQEWRNKAAPCTGAWDAQIQELQWQASM